MRRQGKGIDLNTSLERLAARLDRKNKGALLQTRVAELWGQVAGPAVSEHTTDAHLRGAELVVSGDQPIWATELSALSGEDSKRMNEGLGQERVTSIRFTVSRNVGEKRRLEAAEGRGRGEADRDRVESVPLSETERAQVEASASAIEDAELREAVIRATVADLEWKKGLSGAKNR
jgi:hypothetical protein